MASDEKGLCMLYVSNTCKQFIRTFPNLLYDQRQVEDVDTNGEDHAYDEGRYVLMERPISPRLNEKKIDLSPDPLNQRANLGSRYKFYRI